MIAYYMTLNDLLIGKFDWLVNLFIFRITMNFFYMKTNSLYGSIIPHWLSDLGYDIISK